MRNIFHRLIAVCFLAACYATNETTAADQTKLTAPLNRSKKEILANNDLADPSVRARVVAELDANERARYAAVRNKAQSLGIPERIDGPGHEVKILYDFRGDQPIYRKTLNADAAISSAANLVYPAPYSLNGSGITVGVWDAAWVRSTHREMTGRVTQSDGAGSIDDHATHVAGTIAASGVTPAAKGMAPSARINSYDWNNDYTEMTAAGAAVASDTNKLAISNHSYGADPVTASDMGVYTTDAETIDTFLVGLPYYLPFWAAGNEQDSLTAKSGYQSITYYALSKNIITVGAVQDAVSGTNRSIAAAAMTTFSSWGPSDDGRIKPDVVANGEGVYSTISTGDAAYDSYNGTSMATPSAAGSAALLVQRYAREFSNRFMRASTLKALLIHTADDLGTAGPDYKFGWGLINTKSAADVILAHKNNPGAPKLIESNVTSTATSRSHAFTWDGSSPIRATLAWTDPAGNARSDNDRTPVLVHDLDLRIVGPNGTNYLPYVMPFASTFSDSNFGTAATRGTNRVDNVERVDISTPTLAGQYTAIVSLGGSLSGSTSQTYSLILTGGNAAAPPTNATPVLNPIGSKSVTVGSNLIFSVSANDIVDQDKITLSASGLPAGAVFNTVTNAGGVTNTFVWNNAWPTGTYNVIFRAADRNGTNSETVVISVQPSIMLSGATNANKITINDSAAVSPYPSTISFAGITGTIKRVTPTLRGLTHTYPADIDIVLVGPDGAKSGLMSDSGGGTDISGINMSFDDSGSTLSDPLSTGTWKPSGVVSNMPASAPGLPYHASLTNFIGRSPNGTWSLYMADRADGDTGAVFNGWSLLIEVQLPDNPDLNNDGIPDSWFNRYGLSYTNNADARLPSGATYREMYLYDINPTNALPANFNRTVPTATNAAGPVTVFVIAPSSTGRIYDVFGATNLLNTNWSGFGLNIRGNGGTLNLVVTNQPSERFYRTGVKLP